MTKRLSDEEIKGKAGGRVARRKMTKRLSDEERK